MGEEQWWEEGDEWEHTHSPTEEKGEKEEEEERPLKSLTLGSKTERERDRKRLRNPEQRRKTHKQECEITNSGTKGKARCTENTHRKRPEGVETNE